MDENHIFHKSILALREYLLNNKENVLKELKEMIEKSNQNKMKQTAVEWLEEQFNNPNIPNSQTLFNQAKVMEKEQIIEAYNNGDNRSAELYYNETFKSE